jgi:hypothetical protein
MKKLIIILALGLIIPKVQAQINPGKHQIKLLTTQKVLENYSDAIVLNPACENAAATNCKKQLWELKSVPNRTNVFTLTNAETSKLLSYSVTNEGRDVSLNLRLLPPLPQSQRELQFFYVVAELNPDRTAAGYSIRPYLKESPSTRNYFYVGARASSMNWDNCPVEVDYREDELNDTKEDVRNLLFTFTPITNTVTIGPSRVLSNVVTSPAVVVAPKSDNKLEIDLKTGGDNLEVKSFQENLEIRIIIQNKADVILKDANKNESWPNNSIRRVSIPLPADITIEELKEIHLYRKQKGGIKYVWELGEKDNWDLQSISATATIVSNGVKKKHEYEKIISTRRGNPLYRFTYENNNSETDGTCCKRALSLIPSSLPPAVNTNIPSQNALLTMTFGTGGDNLEGGGGNNVNIKIKFKSTTNVISLNNVNDSAKWNNFTERTVTKEIPNSMTLDINDIKVVEIHHTGGGGMFADNWHVDKIKISIVKDGQTKVLVDKVGAPIHMFTGDTRIKRFTVE